MNKRTVNVLMSMILFIGSSHSSLTFAQSSSNEDAIDFKSPEVIVEESGIGKRGEVQLFAAEIRDNVGIASAKIYYRLSRDAEFTAADMTDMSGGVYTFRLNADTSSVEIVDYYIIAADQAGNETLNGFSFDPLMRILEMPTVSATALDGSVPVDSTNDTAESIKKPSSRKIWYVLGGVVALAAIACCKTPSEPDETRSVVLRVDTP